MHHSLKQEVYLYQVWLSNLIIWYFQIFQNWIKSLSDVIHFMQQLPFPYKVHLNFQSLQFLDVPFNNGNYSVAPLKKPGYSDNKTFHKITSSSIISDSSILSLFHPFNFTNSIAIPQTSHSHHSSSIIL